MVWGVGGSVRMEGNGGVWMVVVWGGEEEGTGGGTVGE